MPFENFVVAFPSTLQGLSAFTASDGPIPTGVWKVQFTDCALKNKKDNKAGKNIEIAHKVLDGHIRATGEGAKQVRDFVNREVRTYNGAPGTGGVNDKGESTDETAMRKIVAILQSIGYPQAVIDGVKDFQPGYLLDAQTGAPHVCYLHTIESNATQDGDVSYITKEKYDLYVAGQWTPQEQGRPATRGQRAGTQGLPGVNAMPSVASAMAGVGNPLGAPAPGTTNPAFAVGAGGPVAISPVVAAAAAPTNGLGALVK